MIKTCSRCLIIKSYSLFSRKTASSDGHKSHCKDCEKLDLSKNVAKDKLLKKKWLSKNKERDKANKKIYQDLNKDRFLLKRREYHRKYELNKLKTDIQYRLKNRLRARLHSALTGKQQPQ